MKLDEIREQMCDHFCRVPIEATDEEEVEALCSKCPLNELEKSRKTCCTCWVEYPNKSHMQKSGKWKCVDRFKNIRQLEIIPLKGLPFPKFVRKTMCERIEEDKE